MSPTGPGGGCTTSVSWNYSSSFLAFSWFDGPNGGYSSGSAGLFSSWWNSTSGPNGSSFNGGNRSQFISWNLFYGPGGSSSQAPALSGFNFPSMPSTGSSTPMQTASADPFSSTLAGYSPMASFSTGVVSWYAAVTR